jgi:hypothetical protein
MKKLILALLLTVPVAGYSQVDAFTSTGSNATATVEVVASVQTALQLNKLQDLWFGNFIAVESGGATTASVTASPTGNTGDKQAGLIEVTGAASQSIVFSVSGGSSTFEDVDANNPSPGAPETNYTVTLENGDSSQKLVATLSFRTDTDSYAADYAPGTSVSLDADGSLFFAVGGEIDLATVVDADDVPVALGVVSGTFKGEVTISASYF